MDGHKRKRDDEGTVVTFYAPNRTFARVYKGQSLSETRDIVRRKLGLSDDTSIRFARLHEGKVIELDDDDDFEAFRHLARYVTSLDVSVFLGQDGPPIFTAQHSQEASANPKNRKRSKKLQQPSSSSVISPGPASSSRSAIADYSSRLQAAASTVDANGVPKKKRRKEHASFASSLQEKPNAGPTVAPISHTGESSGKAVAKDQPHSSAPAPILSTVAALPSWNDNVAPSLADAEGAPRGSKRKRRDSPEPSRPVPDVSSSSSPPRLPSKKKRKDRGVEDTVAPVEQTTSGQAEKSAKKSKRKGRDVSEPTEPILDVHQTPHETVVAGSETSGARKAAKMAKKHVQEREGAERHAAAPEPAVSEPANKSKKQKRKGEAEMPAVQDTTALPPQVTDDLSDSLPSSALPLLTDATPGKDKARKRSKSKVPQAEQVASASVGDQVPAANPFTATAPVKSSAAGKKSKRRQTIQISDAAEEPAPGGEHTAPHAERDDPEAASSKKAKVDRRKTLPASSQDAQDPPVDAMAALQAAFQAVMSRGPSASTADLSAVTSISSAPPPVPARKRNAGRSKLSKVWGPDDLTDDQQPFASASSSALALNVSPAREPTSVVDPPAEVQVKAANVKQAHPPSAPSCLVCEKAAIHPPLDCPVLSVGTLPLRTKIAQLQKVGGDSDLIKELRLILKQAQRRPRKPKASAPPEPPVQIPSATGPAGDIPPSSPDLPLFSLSTASTRRPPLPRRSLSSPRLPAGSEISEVAVESKDEGSSHESSSSDDEHDAPAPSVPASTIVTSAPANTTALDEVDLQALLWGPSKPRSSILAQIPSSSESGSDGESDDSKDEVLDLEEEDKNDRAYRRMSRKLERAASSSDDEREPEPEPVDPDMDVDDIVIPPTIMDPDPNNSVEDAREVEADVLAREGSEHFRDVAGTDKQDSDEEKDEQGLTEEEEKEMMEDPEADDDESEEEDVVRTKPASEREGNPASESGESHAGSGPDTSSADRGDLGRVERTTEDDPLVSQKTPDAAAEDPDLEQPKDADAEQEDSDDDNATGEGEQPSVQAQGSEEGDAETAADDSATAPVDGDTQYHRERELSPEHNGHISSSPGHGPSQHVEEDEDDTTAVQDDPIASSSVVDQVRRIRPKENDPTEDPDVAQPDAEALTQTPPPATPRTPRTVSRMKDRYGRLPQARAKDSAPPLSQQLLGNLVLPAAELTLSANADAGSPQDEHGGALQEEAGAAGDGEEDGEEPREIDHEDEELPELEPETIQDSRESSQPQQDGEDTHARPRRTTRATRQTSTMPPPSSLPEPASTPTPAPPQRGRRRLTEEEKAQREAEKQEKKAERERKAAEKKAEREEKAAAKRAETERRKAAKVAEKQTKDATQRALQEEVAKRGARATRGRGRGRGGKPTSTRSERSVVSVDEPEEEEGVDQPDTQKGEPQASETVSETPAAGKISWATLSQTGPRTQTESVGEPDSSMIDELQPSSPELAPQGRPARGRKKTGNDENTVVEEPMDESLDQGGILDAATPKPKATKEPLFIPSSSQIPTRFELPEAESTPFAHADLHSEVEHDQAEKTSKGQPRPRPSWFAQAMYPTLTDLASQQLFPSTQIPSPALFSQTSNSHASRRLTAQSGKGGEDEEGDVTSDDDDDDDSSDSDGGKDRKKSHIPQNRRAGAAVQKKKKSGLLSAYK